MNIYGQIGLHLIKELQYYLFTFLYFLCVYFVFVFIMVLQIWYSNVEETSR